MVKMTSAYANKVLKILAEDKLYWRDKEVSSSTYLAANNEEPVIPEYNYIEVAAKIEDIDEKMAKIKHALNISNAIAKIPVGDEEMSVDTILIKMAQLNSRKNVLDGMRKRLPKAREEDSFMGKNSVPEYRYINYNLNVVRKDYDIISQKIMEMQMALDKYNQTVSFDVDL